MVTAIEQQLDQLALTDLHDARAVQNAAVSMESLLLAKPASSGVAPSIGESTLRAANVLYETYETNLENDFAARLLRGEVTLSDYPLYERFQRLVGREVEMAEIGPNSQVLFIGSGPFPVSPILTHELSGGASVDCFDLSPEACETSRQVLERLGLNDKIRVFNLTAEDAKLPTVSEQGDIGKYGKVIVALLAQPKDKILSKIWRSLREESTVIVRNSEGNRRVLYQGINPAVLPERYRHLPQSHYHAGVDDTISGSVIKTDYQPWVWRI